MTCLTCLQISAMDSHLERADEDTPFSELAVDRFKRQQTLNTFRPHSLTDSCHPTHVVTTDFTRVDTPAHYRGPRTLISFRFKPNL